MTLTYVLIYGHKYGQMTFEALPIPILTSNSQAVTYIYTCMHIQAANVFLMRVRGN